MQLPFNLRCDGYSIQRAQSNGELIQFRAETMNNYLVQDFNVDGKYLRKVVKQLDDKINIVQLPSGQSLEQLIEENDSISEQTIEIILSQILEGLATLYKNNILGRCFNIYNIIWDGKNITMMNFGFYPEIWQTHQNYDHNLDINLLGQVAYSLITCQQKVGNYEILNCAPVSSKLRDFTSKLLNLENHSIQFLEVINYFENKLAKDTQQYLKNNYQQFSQKIDQIIIEREQQTSYVDVIQIQLEEKEQSVQENMDYLLYFNKQQNQDRVIWEILHNQLYRIYLMTNLRLIIQEQSEQLELFAQLDQLKFIVDKTIYIVTNNFLQHLLNEFQKDHQSFIEQSQSFSILKKVLNDFLHSEMQFLLNNYDLEDLKNQRFKKDTETHFNTEISESNFNDIKLSFRRYVLVLYRYFQMKAKYNQNQGEKLELLKKQLHVLLALIYNQVIENKEKHFKTVKKVAKSNTFRPNDIELTFFKKATADQIQEQIKEIHDMYFS